MSGSRDTSMNSRERAAAVDAAVGRVGGRRPLPTAFQDWANTKAAYRFFANDKVSEDRILAGRFEASALRVQAADGPILVLQDAVCAREGARPGGYDGIAGLHVLRSMSAALVPAATLAPETI